MSAELEYLFRVGFLEPNFAKSHPTQNFDSAIALPHHHDHISGHNLKLLVAYDALAKLCPLHPLVAATPMLKLCISNCVK